MDAPLISVIVPIYKVEPYLDRCVQSIVNQTYGNLEIILVDDGSPDNCPVMCDTWAQKDGRIKVVHKENGGVSAARNAGMRKASGKYFVFVDSDDVVSQYLIEALLVENVGEKCLPMAALQHFSNEALTEKSHKLEVKQTSGHNLAKIRGGMYVVVALYNRKIIEEISLEFDSNLQNLEDVVWNSIYLRYVQSICCITTPLYYYRINSTSITSRCVDRKWQISSWLAAQGAILNWFSEKSLTPWQKKEVRGVFRHCQNNIYAECLAGDISFGQFRQLEKTSAKINLSIEKVISPMERMLKNEAPWVYFECYLMALRLRRMVSKVMRR